MPEIAQRLPADGGRATLAGHSLGGLFTLHAFFSRTDLFSTWVAGSPSIWWNRDGLFAHAEAMAAAAPD
jgi:predicted alpha/beta superfamily hydrolase